MHCHHVGVRELPHDGCLLQELHCVNVTSSRVEGLNGNIDWPVR